jgi:hypothetical protein
VLESIRIPQNQPWYLAILFRHLYLFFVNPRYSADMVQINPSKGRYAYNIAFSTSNLATPF